MTEKAVRPTYRAGVYSLVMAAILWMGALCSAGCGMVAGQSAAMLPLPSGWHLITNTGPVTAITLQENTVWVGTTGGLYRLNQKSLETGGRVDAGPTVTYVRALQIDANGVLWIGHINGLTKWDGASFHSFDKSDGLPHTAVNALALDSAGGLLIGTAMGMARMVNGRIVPAPENAKLVSPVVNAILNDGMGGLWIASSSDPHGGITCLGVDGNRIFRPSDGLPHSYVNHLLAARDGTVWAATGHFDSGGICVFERDSSGWRILRCIGVREGLPEANVRTVFQDRDSDMWAGFESQGGAVLTAPAIRRLSQNEGFPSRELKCVAQSEDGTLWLGTIDGLLSLDPQAIQRLKGK
jgi:ligand-binding sensor domain-containing protein